MQLLIWGVFLAGGFAARYFYGREGAIVYGLVVAVAIALFRKPLTIGLTHVASKVGLMKATIDKLPMSIKLARAAAMDDAARPAARELAAVGFDDAGAWDIPPMPKIKLTLMVHARENMLAAIETAEPIGAQVNLHTLYSDGRVVSYTNSRLPGPKKLPPELTYTRLPAIAPSALFEKACGSRRRDRILPMSVDEAPSIYERLYADFTRYRKTHG